MNRGTSCFLGLKLHGGIIPKEQEAVHENKTVCNWIRSHSVSEGGIILLKNIKIRNWDRKIIHAYVVDWGVGLDKKVLTNTAE